MANIPALTSQGESIADIIVDQRDLLDGVSLTLESALSKLDSIDNILRQQFNAQLRQIENTEFANEEARREADRNRLAGTQADQATAQPVREGSDTSNFASGLMGGLAAAGVGSTLRMLAGRLVTGGGLAAIGLYFGEEIGKFLQTEADAFLDDAGLSSEITDKITSGLAENLDTALIGAGLSKFIFGRTLPGLIAGFVLGGLDIEKLFSSDENIRAEFYGTFSDGDTPGTGLRGELEKGWNGIVENKEAAAILSGAGILAIMTRGPLVTKIAAGLIAAFGLSNLMPSGDDVDSLNTKVTNAIVSELELMGFSEDGAETAVDVGSAAFTGLTTGWLFGLINKRLKIPAMIAGFIYDYYNLSRIFTPEGRESLLDAAEQTIRRILAGEGMTEDYINATVATLGVGGTIFAADQVRRRVRPSGAASVESVVDDRQKLRGRVTSYSASQLEKAGIRQTAPGSFQRLVDGKPSGSFMTYADVDDKVRQTKLIAKYPRLAGRMFGALLGAGISAAEIYLILEDDTIDDSEKARRMGSTFVGFLGGAAVGALIGFVASWYTGPGTVVVTGLASIAGYAFGDWMATAFFEWVLQSRSDAELEKITQPNVSPVQTQAEYEEFIRTNRENFERGPNVGIIEGVTGDPSGAIVRTSPSYAEQYGPGSSSPQVQIVPNQPTISPEQAAIAESITGLQTELEILQAERATAQERLEAASGRNRRSAELRVNRLTDEIEALSEELEKLNDALEPSLEPTAPSNISYTTPSYSRPQTLMAAFRPSFGNARLMNASLSNNAASSSVEQIMEALKSKESGGDYSADNEDPRSSASGAYQYIDSTWKSVTKKYGIGQEYARAKDAPPNIQDEVARRNIQEILAQNNGNIAAVPNMWYSGNAQGRLTEEQLAANDGYTQERYSADFFRRLGQQPPQVAMDDSSALQGMTGPATSYMGSFANLLSGGFADPEAALSTMLQAGFSNLRSVTPAAVALANKSEEAASAQNNVIIAPQNTNIDQSVNGGGGSGSSRENASQKQAVFAINDPSVNATLRNMSDAIYA